MLTCYNTYVCEVYNKGYIIYMLEYYISTFDTAKMRNVRDSGELYSYTGSTLAPAFTVIGAAQARGLCFFSSFFISLFSSLGVLFLLLGSFYMKFSHSCGQTDRHPIILVRQIRHSSISGKS